MKIETVRRIILSGEENDILVKARTLIDKIEGESKSDDNWYGIVYKCQTYLHTLEKILDREKEEN